MGHLSRAIDWWDGWKLRILVLCSLLVQFFLYFSGYVRHRYALRRLRVIVWLAYMCGDALAVYALATLFNRQKQQQQQATTAASALEVVWAPVLLIHLGGQPTISAYSLEDNELWKRNAITLVSQVTVALYVFCKWWSGETRLLQAAVLLFVVGILRSGQKPWALRSASYGDVTSTYSSSPPRRTEEESSSRWWRRLGKWCIAVCTFTDDDDGDGDDCRDDTPGPAAAAQLANKYSLEEYVKEAREHVKEGPKASGKAQREKFTKDEALVSEDIYKMFLDLAAPYSVRLRYLQSFLNLDGENQHKVLRRWIHLQFRAIYTKLRSTATCLGLCTFLVLPSLPLASVVLFAKSDKDGYDKSDITVTYVLFFGTAVMELAPFLDYLLRLSLRRRRVVAWQEDMVSQHNVMSFCARKKQPPTLMKIATFGYLRDFVNKYWYIRYQCVAQHISVLVRHHAEYGWKEYVRDAATYRRFNNLRGQHTHHHHHLLEQGKLGWTFNLPFDEYVLLWHLATDLCLHHTSSTRTNDTTTASSSSHIQGQEDTMESRRSSSEIISNYMIYLLFICPDMLIPGTRSDLFMLACHEIERLMMIHESHLSSPNETTTSGIAQLILGLRQGDDQRMTKAPKISDALKLARVLIHLDEEERWEVIQGVWVEMLCYSASRCRGYLHAKSLGVAAEFLTNVWLLWWCMGMQTLPDMMHNLGSPEELTAATSKDIIIC